MAEKITGAERLERVFSEGYEPEINKKLEDALKEQTDAYIEEVYTEHEEKNYTQDAPRQKLSKTVDPNVFSWEKVGVLFFGGISSAYLLIVHMVLCFICALLLGYVLHFLVDIERVPFTVMGSTIVAALLSFLATHITRENKLKDIREKRVYKIEELVDSLEESYNDLHYQMENAKNLMEKRESIVRKISASRDNAKMTNYEYPFGIRNKVIETSCFEDEFYYYFKDERSKYRKEQDELWAKQAALNSERTVLTREIRSKVNLFKRLESQIESLGINVEILKASNQKAQQAFSRLDNELSRLRYGVKHEHRSFADKEQVNQAPVVLDSIIKIKQVIKSGTTSFIHDGETRYGYIRIPFYSLMVTSMVITYNVMHV